MKWSVAPALLLILSACGTPQEQCINGVSHDLATLNRLIAETQANVQRGYGMADAVEMQPAFVDCTPAPTTDTPKPKARMCFDDVPTTVSHPVALDLTAEKAKLASMLQRRAEMERALAPQLAACRQRYPE